MTQSSNKIKILYIYEKYLYLTIYKKYYLKEYLTIFLSLYLNKIHDEHIYNKKIILNNKYNIISLFYIVLYNRTYLLFVNDKTIISLIIWYIILYTITNTIYIFHWLLWVQKYNIMIVIFWIIKSYDFRNIITQEAQFLLFRSRLRQMIH